MTIAKRSNKQQIINLLITNGAKGIEDLRKQNKLKKQAAAQAAAAAQSFDNQSNNIGATQIGSSAIKKGPATNAQEKK